MSNNGPTEIFWGILNAADPVFNNDVAHAVRWAQDKDEPPGNPHDTYSTVYIPAGTYDLDEPIEITTDGFVLLGASPARTIISYTGSGTALVVGTLGNTISDVVIRNLKVLHGGGASTGGVLVYGPRKVTFENVSVSGFDDGASGAYGFKFHSKNNNGSMPRLLHCEVDGADYGVWVTGEGGNAPTHGTEIIGCRIKGQVSGYSADTKGIFAENGMFGFVGGSTVVTNFYNCIEIGPDDPAHDTKRWHLEDVYTEYCYQGLVVASSSTGHTFENLHIPSQLVAISHSRPGSSSFRRMSSWRA